MLETARGRASADALASAARNGRAPAELPVVCVQGLGFVGSAMAVAVADARDEHGDPCFRVIGVDLPTSDGVAKVEAINAGRLPVAANDDKLKSALAAAVARGNLVATTDERAYARAAVTLVDLPLDVLQEAGGPTVSLDGIRAAVRTLGSQMPPGSLVIVETTVPPGTTEKLIAPEIARALAARGLPEDAIGVAYSYERVMPGAGYFDSVVAIPRSYAGHTPAATDACEEFLSRVIDVEAHPLSRLHSTTACELAKVLENSYRATIIAFMEEWGRFAEAIGVDLFSVIASIRQRPTHSNMRRPGFGVGGYCLTKDPLLAGVSARELHLRPDLEFPFSTLAVSVNRAMPMVSLQKIGALLPGGLAGAKIALMGVSYREDVADTRQSPSETFVREASERGAAVVCHDPLVRRWAELGIEVLGDPPPLAGVDAVVFAVPHNTYRQLDVESWLGEARPVVLDSSDVLSPDQRATLARLGCTVASIGRGDRA
jgi:nucleotide sugar dehydrogenase